MKNRKQISFVVILVSFILVAVGCDKKNTNSITQSKEIAKNIDEGEGNEVDMNNYKDIKIDDTVFDVVMHPSFEGFGEFILPIDAKDYDKNMTIRNVESLLPYHSNIYPNMVVEVINTIINGVDNGEINFYDIYTEQEKKENMSKDNSGIFHFKGKDGAPFAIICPGGGFSYVGSIHEGFPHAIELSNMGYNVFVLQYRIGGSQVACEDLSSAVSYIFKNAEQLNVSTEGYSVWGSSAGARMAAYFGSYGTKGFIDEDLPRPSTVIMAYTGHSDFTVNDPPTFIAVGEEDRIASPLIMEKRADAMKSVGIDIEFKKYSNLGHGFGLGIGTSAEGWISDAVEFWEKNIQ